MAGQVRPAELGQLVRRDRRRGVELDHRADPLAEGRAGAVEPDLRVAGAVRRLRRGVVTTGVPASLTTREQEVLRLLADGQDTQEIAASLCYSERTVKGVIHEITTRLQLRNRSHAVAFALRNDLI